MRKLTVISMLTIFLCMVSVKALAYDVAVENKDGVLIYYEYISSNGQMELEAVGVNKGYSGPLDIPETVAISDQTLKVTRVRDFNDCIGLTSVTIPNTVTKIAPKMFDGCISLTEVILSDGTEGMHMPESYEFITFFDKCPIEKIYLGRNLTYNFGSGSGVSYHYYSPFRGKTSLKTLTIGDGVTFIYCQAFSGCSSLTEVTIPKSVSEIYSGAFNGCSSMKNLTIESNDVSIDSYAFSGCSSLEELIIPDNVNYIGSDAFRGCTSLTKATIGNGVKSIGSGAFWNCSGLEEIVIGSSVTNIGNAAFARCYSLTSVTSLNTTPPQMGVSPFEGITEQTAVLHVPTGCKEIYQSKQEWRNFFNIQDDAQGGILDYDFEENGIYYNYGTDSQTAVVTYKSIPDRGYSGIVIIPEMVLHNGVEYAVTEINEYTFMGCTGLTKVNIPNSVKYIGRCAFQNCGLIEVVIPNSVVEIGPTAFADCKELTSVIISDNVTKIDEVTFMGCSNLTELVIGNSVTEICTVAFYGCSKLASVTIPNSVISIGSYAFEGCSSLTELVIGSGVAFISDAFGECYSLVSITSLNPTPPEIEEYTFISKTYQAATLHVMIGSKLAYEQAPYWQEFFSIQEDVTDGVNSVVTDMQKKNEIYTLSGKKLNTTKLSDLAKGIYIVNGKKYVVK